MAGISDIWGLQPTLDSKAPVGHKHRIGEIEELQAALAAAGQGGGGGGGDIASIDGLQTALNSKAPIDALTGLQEQINGKASLTGTAAAFSTLQQAIDGKAAAAHTQAIDTITGLQTALDGKAAATHSHATATASAAGFMSAADKAKLDGLATSTGPAVVAIADVTGLQTALDSKSDTTHTHGAATASASGFLSAADKAKLDGLTAENTAPSQLTYTASQSSVYGGATGSYANLTDGSYTTGAGTDGAGSVQWIQADLGSVKTINRIQIAGGTLPVWGAIATYINNLAYLEFSTDGSTWCTLIQLLQGISDTASRLYGFAPFKARYVRIVKYSATNTYVGLGEFRIYG